MMRIFLVLCIAIGISACTNPNKNYQNADTAYQIIPKPATLEPTTGRFVIHPEVRIAGSAVLHNEVTYLAGLIQKATGYILAQEPASAQTGKNVINLKIDDAIAHEEGYTMDIQFDRITISGKTPQGVFYGIQSLRQLLPVSIELGASETEELTIPCVKITDEPLYTYRGMHLDVGRHLFPTDFIKKYIDLIAMHKMNRFHWHLTEDQGWRIEIKKYPRLTTIGSQRSETILEKNFNPYIGDKTPYGGFYTQEEVKEIVAYAAAKHITIIPEIELPGHSRAALAAYPEFGNTGDALAVGKRWGVYDQIYAPKEETFAFLEDVLTEVMELFPSPLIHIGGDEAPKKEWEESAYAQEVIKREGLKNEHELQSYFIKRIEKFLNANGRNIIGWDEILEGGLAPNAAVMSWRGTAGGIEAAKQGHYVVMTPGSHCYFDHYQVDKEQQADEPLAIGGFTSVEKVYHYDPTPEALTEEQQKYIMGTQGNVWTEYMKDSNQVEYMVLPRMSALSEVAWSPKSAKDWTDFKMRLTHLKERYEALGLNYGPHIFQTE